MKKFGIYIVSGGVMFTYVVSVVGFGIHTCQHQCAQHLTLFTEETCACWHVHDNAQPQESCCSESQHTCSNTEQCCDVQYKSLHVDQDVLQAKSVLKSFTEQLTLFFLPVMIQELPQSVFFAQADYSPSPLTSNTIPDIYRMAQLRL